MDATQKIGIIYCAISLLCATILILSAKTIKETTSKYSIARYVFFSYLFAGLATIFDCTYALREIVGINFKPAISYILTIAYVICADLTGTYWILYAEKKLNSFFTKTKKRLTMFMIPLFVAILLTALTPFTRWFFYFEGNTYQRGPIFVILSLLLFVYIIQNGIKAIILSFRKENYVERNEYRRLFIYAFAYLLIQEIQLKMPAIFPYRSVGTMLIFVVILNQNLKEMIGVDGLTHINNRYAVDRYLGEMMSLNHEFELAMFDIDKFKQINDMYGHIEGDKALKIMAESLKEIALKNCFVARWGGDEFILVNNDKNNSIQNIEEKINQNLNQKVKSQNCKYNITVSAGCITKDSSIKSIPDLLKSADDKLYARKKSKE